MSIDFEDTMFEGVSLSAKGSVKGSAKGKIQLKKPAKTPAKKPAKKPSFARFTGKISGAVNAQKAPTVSVRPTVRVAVKPASAPVTIKTPTIAKLPFAPKTIAAKTIAAKTIAAKTIAAKAPIALPKSPALPPAKILKIPEAAREVIAAKIATKAVAHLAQKPPAQPKTDTRQDTARKAHKAIKPICDACRCKPQKVILHIERGFSRKGYPPATVHAMLAALHDMNKRLEQAAIQKLATYEHRRLKSEAAFRSTVLRRLHKIACNLPECHPTRSKAIARIVSG